MNETYLVTGGMGCIGAWTLYHLVQRGEKAVSFDVSEDRYRLDLLMSQEQQAQITFVTGDLRDSKQVRELFEAQGITRVVHLAALQVPASRDNPVLGSQVNVTGTINIFEAARHTGLEHIAFASSIATYGSPDDYDDELLGQDAPLLPHTLYGVFKVTNEMTARVYWTDCGISSTALRPYVVYGVGRDQGLTSTPTTAMRAAARGEDYHIPFGGRVQFHYASDMARQFIEAANKPLAGAFALNLGQPLVSVAEVADIIMQARPDVTITFDEKPLPFPVGCDGSELRRLFENVYETPVEQGVRETLSRFEQL